MGNIPYPQSSGNIMEGGMEDCKRQGTRGQLQSSVFRPWQMYTQEFSSRMTDCLSPVQNCTRQNFSIGGGRAHKTQVIVEELRSTNSC